MLIQFQENTSLCFILIIIGKANTTSPSGSTVLPPEPPGIMKPDIVFFGEGLGEEFHTAVAIDKDEVKPWIIPFMLIKIFIHTVHDVEMLATKISILLFFRWIF